MRWVKPDYPECLWSMVLNQQIAQAIKESFMKPLSKKDGIFSAYNAWTENQVLIEYYFNHGNGD